MERIIRNLKRKGQNNTTKILSLAVGLAVVLVLLAKVYFEQSYDNFYPDADRIYQIQTKFRRGDEAPKENGQVSGAIAPGMKAEVPGVELATRFTYITGSDAPFTSLADGREYNGGFILADSCFFDVLPRPMLSGDAKDVLSRPMYAMVSSKINEMMGGNALGKEIYLGLNKNRLMTIGGVFEALPENSHIKYDIVVSLSSIASFTGDGRNNWVGNDRYSAYVKLDKNIEPESLAPAILEMQKRNQPLDEIKASGGELGYTLLKLKSIYNDGDSAKRTRLIFSIMAIAILALSLLNYVLITTTNLVSRAKEIATHKSFGATKWEIMKMIFLETLVSIVLGLVLAALIILVLNNQIHHLIGTRISDLFSVEALLLLLAICLFIIVFTALIPVYLFSKVPIANVMRSLGESHKIWRLSLLGLEFIAISFFVYLLCFVGIQYNEMMNENTGYNYKNLVTVSLGMASGTEYDVIRSELEGLGAVEHISIASNLPYEGRLSGNNVSVPNDVVDIFNMADFETVGDDIGKALGLSIIEGEDLNNDNVSNDLLVSKDFADKVCKYANWESIIGKSLRVSMWGNCRVTGVYEDIRLGSATNADLRPSAMVYHKGLAVNLLVRLHTLDKQSISAIQSVLDKLAPNKKLVVRIAEEEIASQYTEVDKFRTQLIISGLITLIIALVGLLGYTAKEISRRSKEIAIRKINGSNLSQIVLLFTRDMLWIAIPSILIGAFVAWYTASQWSENFSPKANIAWWIYLGCGLLVLAIIELTVALIVSHIANKNPIDALKNK